MSACHFCGATLDPKMRIVRDTECPSCGRDLHACVQCRHYDRHAHNQCREPQAEWVTDRERRNFCDYFALRLAAGAGAGVPDREKSARSKLDQLFKGPDGAPPAGRPKPADPFGRPKPSDPFGESPDE